MRRARRKKCHRAGRYGVRALAARQVSQTMRDLRLATDSTHAQRIIDLLRPAFLETEDRRVGAAIRELLTMQGELAADDRSGVPGRHIPRPRAHDGDDAALGRRADSGRLRAARTLQSVGDARLLRARSSRDEGDARRPVRAASRGVRDAVREAVGEAGPIPESSGKEETPPKPCNDGVSECAERQNRIADTRFFSFDRWIRPGPAGSRRSPDVSAFLRRSNVSLVRP